MTSFESGVLKKQEQSKTKQNKTKSSPVIG